MSACMTSWFCMFTRRGSCIAMFANTVAALAMAPSRLLDRMLISGSIASASAAALGTQKRNARHLSSRNGPWRVQWSLLNK